MKDGLYLATYLHIDPLSRAIGWWQRHDQNLSLWRLRGENLKLLRYWEMERLTGQKQHFTSFSTVDEAREFVRSLLHVEGIAVGDIAGIFGTPGLDTFTEYHSLQQFPLIPYHTVCHLFSAIGITGRGMLEEDMLVLGLDGGPDRVVDGQIAYEAEYAAAVVKSGRIQTVPLSVSPGRLWYLARKRFGMQEGSLMALQTASLASFNAPTISGVDLRSFSAILAWLEAQWQAIEVVERDASGIHLVEFDRRFTIEEHRISMAIKLLHELSVAILTLEIDGLLDRFRLSPERMTLAIAGGYGLNCPANRHLLQQYCFKRFLAPPCVNDAGISLGAALYCFWKHNSSVRFLLDRINYGPELTPQWLERLHPVVSACIDLQPLDVEQCVSDITAGPVIWMDGGCEMGPRALGHRSLLGDPRTTRTRDQLNAIKRREWWRPVAPIVIYEEVANWFAEPTLSPYMLLTATVLQHQRNRIPAVLHLDGTARIQTANRTDVPRLFPILQAFHRATGVPMLANTSLNDRGEPIIDDVERALYFAVTKGLGILYIDGIRACLDLRSRDVLLEHLSQRRPHAALVATPADNEEVLQRYNPHGLSLAALQMYCRLPVLRESYDISLREDADRVAVLCEELVRRRSNDHGATAHSALLHILKEIMPDRSPITAIIDG